MGNCAGAGAGRLPEKLRVNERPGCRLFSDIFFPKLVKVSLARGEGAQGEGRLNKLRLERDIDNSLFNLRYVSWYVPIVLRVLPFFY